MTEWRVQTYEAIPFGDGRPMQTYHLVMDTTDVETFRKVERFFVDLTEGKERDGDGRPD